MDRRQLLLVAVLSITCCVYAQQGQHTVFAMVLGKGAKKLPEIKVNGVKMNLHTPVNPAAQEPGALVQGAPTGTTTFIVGGKASDNNPANPPVMAEALVMPAPSKPKTVQEKAMDDLKLTKEEKEKLFPCDDYEPYCKNYAATGQCRDVFTQRNCRKSCGLCDVPYGVFIGCHDLDVCKKFAASACMVHWVRETCKTKCGSCGYERQANAHITMGKKRHFSDTNKKQSDKTTHDVKKIDKKQKDKVKQQLQKVIKKMAKKAKDVAIQAAAQVETLKKKNDRLAVVKKPLIKPKETQSDDVSDDDVNDNDDDNDDDDDANDQDVSGEGSSDVEDEDDDDDDDDDDDNASGEAKIDDKPEEPIRLDTDPRGEPVVAKMVNRPIKFNDAPEKAMHVVLVKSKKPVKVVKDAKPKVEEKKKTAKKVNSDKVEKKIKQIKKVVKQDKPKTNATKPKKLKN